MLAATTPQNLVRRTVHSLQVILQALGAPVEIDDTFGPVTARTWEVLAKSKSLDPSIQRVDAGNANVDKKTHDTLLIASIEARAPRAKGSTPFERLNNAVNRITFVMRKNTDGERNKLLDDIAAWVELADPVKRSALMAVPPVFAARLNNFWEIYKQLYYRSTEAERLQLVPPRFVQPGGTQEAFVMLWGPAQDAAAGLARDTAAAIRAKLRAAGAEIGKGAAEEIRDTGNEWLFALGGAAAMAGLAYLYFKRVV